MAAGLVWLLSFLPVQSASGQATQAAKIDMEAFSRQVADMGEESFRAGIALRLAEKRELQAGVLADPVLALSRQGLPMASVEQSPTHASAAPAKETSTASWEVTLSQSLPWPGTLAAEEQAFREQKQVARIEQKIDQAERQFAAKNLFLNMIKLYQSVLVQKKIKYEADSFRDYIHERYRHGIADHAEFLQAQSDAALNTLNLETMDANLANLKAYALLLLGKAAFDFELGWPSVADDNPGDDKESRRNVGAVENIGRQQILAVRDRDLSNRSLSLKRNLPGFSVSGMLMRGDDGMQSSGAMLGLSIPVFSGAVRNSIRGEIDLTQERVVQELAWFDKQQNLARAQNQVRIMTLRKNLHVLNQDILPKVAEHLEASMVTFAQGKGRVGNVVTGRRELLNMEMARIEAMTALAAAQITDQRIEAGLIAGTLEQNIPLTTLGSMTAASMDDTAAMTMGKNNNPKVPMTSRGRTQQGMNGSGLAPADSPQSGENDRSSSGMGMGM